MTKKSKLFRFVSALKNHEAWHSYSQCGEDLIVNFIFENYLHIQKPSYLDIGAHHPTLFSNTYFFYLKNCQGVCVEADPILCEKIKKKRGKDNCLNLGIGLDKKSKADFYIMSSKTLNTFSKSEAERYQSFNDQTIEKIIQIPMLPINEVIDSNFDACPHFISLDVEGLDEKILNTFDFSKYRPQVFCIETLTYTQDKSERKIYEINDIMLQNGYFVYADTYINTIFVDTKAWDNRK